MKQKYKIGDIINFNYSDSIFSYAIKKFNIKNYGKSLATHSGIISQISSDGQIIWVHESIWSIKGKDFKQHQYTKQALDEKKKEGTITVRRCKYKLYNAEEIIKSYEYIRYDWLSIILMPFKLSINSTKFMFCSEVCGRIWYDSSKKKFNAKKEGKEWEKWTPMDAQLTKQANTIK